MFCPKCGAEAGNARYCRSCGTNLTVVSNVLEEAAPPELRPALAGQTTFNLFHSSRLSNERDLNGHMTMSVFGGTHIDLTAAPLASGETMIRVISVFGGAEVLVPDNVAIRVTGISIFGGVSVRGRGVGGGIFSMNEYETPGYAQATRRLHIDATSVFGGLNLAGC